MKIHFPPLICHAIHFLKSFELVLLYSFHTQIDFILVLCYIKFMSLRMSALYIAVMFFDILSRKRSHLLVAGHLRTDL